MSRISLEPMHKIPFEDISYLPNNFRLARSDAAVGQCLEDIKLVCNKTRKLAMKSTAIQLHLAQLHALWCAEYFKRQKNTQSNISI